MTAKEYLISNGPILNFNFMETFFIPNLSLTLVQPTNPSLSGGGANGQTRVEVDRTIVAD